MSRRKDSPHYNHKLSYVGMTAKGQRCYRCVDGYFLVPAGISFANNHRFNYLIVVYTPFQGDAVERRIAITVKTPDDVFSSYLELLKRVKEQNATLYKTHRHNPSQRPHDDVPGKCVLGVEIPKGIHLCGDNYTAGIWAVWYYGIAQRQVYVGRVHDKRTIKATVKLAQERRLRHIERFERSNRLSYASASRLYDQQPAGVDPVHVRKG